MDDEIKETLGILQEECGELVVAISKCNRFGLTEKYDNGPTNKEKLTQEVGDILAMISILVDQGILNQLQLEQAKNKKLQKLRIWSNIFKVE